MFFRKNKRKSKSKKQLKLLDGLKKRPKQAKLSRNFLNFNYKKAIQEMSKPLKIILVVIPALILSIVVLYYIPQSRSRIDLIKMIFSGKHLILFQNNAELRSTGGFIGSFAVVDTKYGRIRNTYFDTNIYKRDNEFSRNYQVTPKDPVLAEFVPAGNLAMRDSNWALDYSEAAREVAWFYAHEGGSEVENVVAIDTEFFKNLLKIIGPISLPKYNTEITAENFLETVQNKVEKEYFSNPTNLGVDEPKSILSEMMPIVISRIKNSRNWPELYSFIFKQLEEKHLLLYSNNQSIQSTIVKNNWGGTIPKTNYDYLYINNCNLGSNKSNVFINESIELNINKSNDKIAHELIFTRIYPKIDYAKHSFIDENSNNKNYSRVLLPKDSKVISVKIDDQNIDQSLTVSEESGMTKLGFWTNVDYGTEIKVEINYETKSKKSNQRYDLYVQKQPGAVNQNVKIILDNQIKYDGEFNTDLEI